MGKQNAVNFEDELFILIINVLLMKIRADSLKSLLCIHWLYQASYSSFLFYTNLLVLALLKLLSLIHM